MTATSPLIDLHRFEGSDALALALAEAVATDLRRALVRAGRASLAVSGGSTPQRFMQALSRQVLDWEQVTVTLVDERWVPESHPRSNAALVRTHLLQHAAAGARLLPLFSDVEGPEAALRGLEAKLAALPLPLDVAVLGMGDDGHTASFFPDGDRLEAALDPAGTRTVTPMHAATAGEPRITLTLPVLRAARSLYLHIQGQGKWQVLQQALSPGPGQPMLPIARVLESARAPVPTYWCA